MGFLGFFSKKKEWKFSKGDTVRVTPTNKFPNLIRQGLDEYLRQTNGVGFIAEEPEVGGSAIYLVCFVQNAEGNWLGAYCFEDELESYQ